MEIHFHGDRLDGAAEVHFYQPGITLSNLEVKAPKHAVARINIAADAVLGEHSLRLRTSGGLTELRSFWVGQFPSVDETEPNSSFEQAQRIELNTTVQGTAGNEDEDYFVCTLRKGQRLSVEVEGIRLGRTMFDTYVAILDSKKFELAACDDSPLLRTDSFVSIIAPEDGDYRVVVREAAYEGTNESNYRLHVGTFPRPKAVFPTGGKPGESIEFTFIGDPSGPIKQTITLPSEPISSFPLFPIHDGLAAPSPHWITVSPLEAFRESGANINPDTATAMPAIPCAVHGVLDEGILADWYSFTAKKDQNLVIKVMARSHRSPMDPVLSLHQADGKSLAANDDKGGPDSVINWTCPADGSYRLSIRDQLSRTGEDYTYRIEISEKSPGIIATLPTVERVNSQKWKTFPVPKGNRYAAVVNVARENIACDVTFQAETLPPGITLHAPNVSRSVTSFPVIFEAAPDATLTGGLHAFTISSSGDAPPLTSRLVDTIHHVDINNEGAYHSASFDRIAMAVTNEAPFRIELEEPPAPIVRNGSLGLKVRAIRQEGYNEKITVRFLWNPPGISGPVTIDIPPDQSEISYELNANGEAPSAEWQVCVLAEANTPTGPVVISSGFTTLKVVDPYIALTLDLAATEQSKNTSMLAKIEIHQPFEGEATVELMGLPHGAASPPQNITKDMAEIQFPVSIAADATIGKHNGVFCRVRVPFNGSTILHQTAMNSTLRIDAPAPVATTAEAQPAPAAAAQEAPSKPLSRLEQLRQQAK